MTRLALFLIALVWVGFGADCGARADTVVRVGAYENEPLVFRRSGGEHAGFCVDVLEHVAAEEGWELEYITCNWSECLKKLESGEIDLQVAIGYSKSRARRFDFNDETLISNWGCVYRRPGSKIDSILDLKGRSIAILEGDIHAEVLRDRLHRFDLEGRLVEVSSYAAVFQSVETGEVDAGLVSRLMAARYESAYDVEPTPIVFNPIEIRYAAPKGQSRPLLKTLDRHLAALKPARGSTYHKSLGRWFGRPVASWLPRWVKLGVPAAGVLLAALLAGNLVLRRQVRRQTSELSERNEELQREVAKREQAEIGLRASETRFRRLVEHAADAFFLHDLEGRFVDVNEQACRSLGYTREELLRMSVPDVAVDHDIEEVRRLLADLGAEGPVTVRDRHKRKDGSTFPAEIRIDRIGGGEEHLALSIARDVTERHRTEEALRESRAQLRSTIDSLPFDFIALDAEGRYVLQNAVCRKRWGNLVGKRPQEIGVPEDLLNLWLDNNRRAMSGETVTGEVEYTSGGEKLVCHNIVAPVRDGERIIGMLAVNLDISDRKQMEQALRDAHERLSATVGALPDLLFEVDREGRILNYHAPNPEMLFMPAEKFLGRSVADLLPEEAAKVIQAAIDEAAETGRHVGAAYPLETEQGQRWFELSIAVKGGIASTGPRFIALVRDITQRKRLEEQLFQSQKMEAVGTLASGIAHDFNNLLQVISGHVQLMLLRRDQSEGARVRLTEIERTVDRAADLVRQLLVFSRGQAPDLKPVDLNQEVRGIAEMLERTIPKMIRIETDLAPEPQWVGADSNQVEHVLMNLGTNARDAMPDGGTLTIGTHTVALDADYCAAHPGAEAGQHVRLTVTDNGTGMDRETLGHIFDPFFSTKEVGKGTGLGLSTVYGIIANHGGHVACASEPGRGTTFEIYLPVYEKDPQPASLPAVMPEVVRGGEETILVVDDERPVLDLIQESFESFGYTTLVAEDGERALEIYRSDPGIALVILDIGMPGMGGKACLREILKLDPQAKVIIASGYSSNDQAREAFDAGAAGFVAKPYRATELLARVRETLDG